MACTNLSAVFGVVFEIFRCHCPVFITNQAVAFYHRRIEFYLQLHIFRDGKQGAAGFFNQDFSCLRNIVNVILVAVAVISHRFHLIVLIITHSITEYR